MAAASKAVCLTDEAAESSSLILLHQIFYNNFHFVCSRKIYLHLFILLNVIV